MRVIWPYPCAVAPVGISRGLVMGSNVINFSTGVVALATVVGGRRGAGYDDDKWDVDNI